MGLQDPAAALGRVRLDMQEEVWGLTHGSWKECGLHRAHLSGHPKPTCRVSLSICISSACFSCSKRLRSPSSSSTFNLQEDDGVTRCCYSPAMMEGHGHGGDSKGRVGGSGQHLFRQKGSDKGGSADPAAWLEAGKKSVFRPPGPPWTVTTG